MATIHTKLTRVTNTAPVIVRVSAKELSGAAWVSRFPTSTAIGDLAEPFRSNVESFISAIAAAGGTATISATYRPPERAHLMHYCSRLAGSQITAASIPEMAGVNIEWVHPTERASVNAAAAMASGYGIVYPPALISRHTQRRAVDMTILNVIGTTISDAAGDAVSVSRLSDLNAAGATFGVIKLVSDPPHWSDDGH